MIFEYSQILVYFSLSCLIFLATLGSKTVGEMVRIHDDRGDDYRKRMRRLDVWAKGILFFLILMGITRVSFFVITPTELAVFDYIPSEWLYLLLASAAFLLIWSLCLYFFLFRREFRAEERLKYMSRIFSLIIIIAATDIIVTALLQVLATHHVFTIDNTALAMQPGTWAQRMLPLLVIIAILFLIMIMLFILFIYRRSLNLVRQYWISMGFLLVALGIFAATNTAGYMGWYESNLLRIQLLSWKYGFLGWSILLALAITIFTNISAIIISAYSDKLINPGKAKYTVITFIKTGFISAIMLTLLIALPELLLGFYYGSM